MSKSEVGRVLHETYRLERLIGEGSMGAVYEAAHLRLRRRFAVKLLLPSATAPGESMARFRREAEITSELGHPNIVEVVDFNQTDDGATYIVMELLDGEDLGSRIRREGRIPLIDAERILRQAASALQAAHELGVVHRDLKPQNLFLSRRRDEVAVKVLDFGISKVLSSQSQMTRAETLMGTPSYMAPELAQGHAAEATTRTDIFGLGAIGFEMLCGQPPFVGVSVLAVLFKVVHEPTPSVRSFVPAVPVGVDEVLQQAMSKQPEDRFASMDELADAFTRALGSTVVERQAEAAMPPIAASPTQPSLPPMPAPPPVGSASLETLPPDESIWTGPGVQAGALAAAATLASHTGSTLSASVGELTAATRPPRRASRLMLAALSLLLLAGGATAALLLIPAGEVTGRLATVSPEAGAQVAANPGRSEPDSLPPRRDSIRVAAPAPDAAPPEAADSSAPASPDRGAAPIRPVAQSGTLRVACPDGVAKVLVDGKLVGETIWTGTVRAGPHTVEVKRGSRMQRRRIVIKPGSRTNLAIELPEKP